MIPFALLAVANLVLAGALVWRAREDAKALQHLVHLLVAKTPAEAVHLDRASLEARAAAATGYHPAPVERPPYQADYEDVGLRPVGT